MTMRWEDERYVRLYTRDTVDWLGLPWESRALFVLVLRKLDRAGLLDLGKAGPRGLAALVSMPLDVVDRALPPLLEDGCLEMHGQTLVAPNFIEAQESSKSPTARQAESRVRRRDMIRAGLDPRQRETVIYFIQSEHGGPIKIGRADDLAKRLVGLQTSRPDKLVVLAAAPGTVAQEKALHERFAVAREKGEWFSAISDLMQLVRDVAGRGSDAIRDATTRPDDGSQTEACHETKPVTPSLAMPSLAVPSKPSTADGGPDERWALYRRAVADRLAKPADWFRLASADRAPAARAALDAELVRLGVERAADIVADRARREGVKRWLSYYTGLLSEATRVERALAPAEPLPAPDPAFLEAHPGSREVWAEYEQTARSKATSDADLARLLKTSLFLFTNAYTEAA